MKDVRGVAVSRSLDYGWEDNEKTAELPGDMGITEKLTSSILRISHVRSKSGRVVPKKRSNWAERIDKFEPAKWYPELLVCREDGGNRKSGLANCELANLNSGQKLNWTLDGFDIKPHLPLFLAHEFTLIIYSHPLATLRVTVLLLEVSSTCQWMMRAYGSFLITDYRVACFSRVKQK